MSSAPAPNAQDEDSRDFRNVMIGIVIGIVVLTVGLVVIAIVLAVNAGSAAPAVVVIRDVMIIVLALEMVVIGVAITVFLIQVARFVNLLNNEVQPLITSTSDTINTVRGTAVFLSKNLAEPIIAANSTLRGIGKVLKDVDAIRTAAGVAAAAASAAAATGTRAAPGDPPVPEGDREAASVPKASSRSKKKAPKKGTTQENEPTTDKKEGD